jgi:hypothetical protein
MRVMRFGKWICWLKGHLWQFYNGHVEIDGTPLYYSCGRCGKRA